MDRYINTGLSAFSRVFMRVNYSKIGAKVNESRVPQKPKEEMSFEELNIVDQIKHVVNRNWKSLDLENKWESLDLKKTWDDLKLKEKWGKRFSKKNQE